MRKRETKVINENVIAPIVMAPENECLEKIEAERESVLKDFKSNKRWSVINMIVVVALTCGGLIMFVNKEIPGLMWAGVGVIGLAIAYTIFMYFWRKRKYPVHVKKYIEIVTDCYNKIIFNNPDVSELCWEIDGKIPQSDINSDFVYKDVTAFFCRDHISGTIKGTGFDTYDISMNKQFIDEKKRQCTEVLFAGKYITIRNDVSLNGRVVITTQTSGDQKYDIPNNVEDLQEISKDEDTTIYAANAEAVKALGSKFVSAAKAIKIKEPLLNFTIVVFEGHTGIYLSYSNAIINVPFDKPVNGETLNIAKEQVTEALKLATLLIK